jgi:hypothetical protein
MLMMSFVVFILSIDTDIGEKDFLEQYIDIDESTKAFI